ncbi:hypothetical protein QOT17_013204 [Balamuthia mandrillaris]
MRVPIKAAEAAPQSSKKIRAWEEEEEEAEAEEEHETENGAAPTKRPQIEGLEYLWEAGSKKGGKDDGKGREKGEKTVRKRRPRPKLTVDLLNSASGLAQLQLLLADFDPSENQADNLRQFFLLIELWKQQLLPSFAFDDFIEQLEGIGSYSAIKGSTSRPESDAGTFSESTGHPFQANEPEQRTESDAFSTRSDEKARSAEVIEDFDLDSLLEQQSKENKRMRALRQDYLRRIAKQDGMDEEKENRARKDAQKNNSHNQGKNVSNSHPGTPVKRLAKRKRKLVEMKQKKHRKEEEENEELPSHTGQDVRQPSTKRRKVEDISRVMSLIGELSGSWDKDQQKRPNRSSGLSSKKATTTSSRSDDEDEDDEEDIPLSAFFGASSTRQPKKQTVFQQDESSSEDDSEEDVPLSELIQLS